MQFHKILVLASLFAITATVACKKTETPTTTTDTEAPALTITAPIAGAMPQVADAVAVTGTTSDNDELHELTLELRKTGTTAVLWTKSPIVHDLKSYSFSETIPSGLATGDYTLTATAEDHNDLKTIKTVAFMVMP